MVWKPEAGKHARLRTDNNPCMVEQVFDTSCGKHGTAMIRIGADTSAITVVQSILEEWEPREGERVRVVSLIGAPRCPIRDDLNQEVRYSGRQANRHRVQRLNGTQQYYLLDPDTLFVPAIDVPRTSVMENIEAPEEVPACVWCEPGKHGSLCDRLQEVHANRLKAGGVDTDFTRAETRRFVARQALNTETAGPNTFVRTSDRAGFDDRGLANTSLIRWPQDEKQAATLSWEAWETPAWDYPNA